MYEFEFLTVDAGISLLLHVDEHCLDEGVSRDAPPHAAIYLIRLSNEVNTTGHLGGGVHRVYS